MKAWVLGAVLIVVACAAGCGGNSTAVSVTVTGPTGTSPFSTTGGFAVPPSGATQLVATVSGITATTVYWQVCLPAGFVQGTTTATTKPPTNCSPASGPSQCKLPSVKSPLTGYGTVTPNGLYTAPANVPSPNIALVVATSCVNTTAFGVFQVIIESPFKVTVTPSTATIGTGQTFQFNATVQGAPSSGVTWAVCTSAATGSSGSTCSTSGPEGQITGNGLYTAPGTSPSSGVTIQATSVADPNQTGTATVTVVAATAPALSNFSTSYPSPIAPTIAAAGSFQQDIYVNGSNFLSTEEVFVGPAGQAPTAVPTLLISTSLLRATIPEAQLAAAGSLQVSVQTPDGSLVSGTASFTLFPTRPALISELPDSALQGSPSPVPVALTGGFFSTAAANATTVAFNGTPVSFTLNGSRQLTATLQGSALQTEGLFPIVVQNAGVASGEPSMAGMNFAVTPAPSSIPTGAVASATVGANPTAVAIDKADGIAVVANTGGNSVSLVSLASNSVTNTITVGNQPTGVAVDDQLFHPVALVVNSADQTVTAIDLTNDSVAATLSVAINVGPNPPLPYAIGVNPVTAQPVAGAPLVHRALVAYQSSNQATVLDVSENTAGTLSLSIVQTVGSTSVLSFSTGAHPAVAIDPRLNWAMVTPGGSGSVGMVDLGRDPVAGVDVGRAPQVIASVTGSVTVQGIGANPETHEVLLSDPNLSSGNLTVFSPLDQTARPVTNPCTPGPSGTCTGTPFNGAGFGAAAVNPLTDVGVAVAQGSAVVVNLGNAVVLQNVTLTTGTGAGGSSSPQAVAVDPILNEAVVVNSAQNSVSVLSLGGAINPMQIVETSSATTFASTSPVTLTVTGSFATGSTVRLDQQPLATAPVAATCNGTICRQLSATVPVADLGSARRFAVDVQAPSLAVSNIEDFTAVQAVPITCISGQTPCKATPVGVAVDPDHDLAVVTNSADSSASLISLANGSESPLSLGPVGQLSYSPVQVGSSPAGVGVFPRAGLAIVANSGSNNVTAIDETGLNTPTTITLCASSGTLECVAPVGVAIDGDTATAVVTNTNPSNTQIAGSVSTFALSPLATSASSAVQVDPNPVAAAVDPNLDYAAVATASQASSVDILSLSGPSKVGGITGVLQNPSGVIFDPVNQVFLTADSLQNQISIIDPSTFLPTSVATGIAPSSLDYSYQTSTLVTLNGPSRTMSVLAYLCPPSGSAPTCIGPQVRSVLGLGGSQNSTTVLGPSAVAVDPKLNLAVVVDPDNSRVLLVPLPQ